MISLLAHADHEHTAGLLTTMPVLAGLVAGAAHVFLGPDHMAAVAPLAVEQRRRPWAAGIAWGCGHSSGVWLLAVLALVFREALPIDAISGWSERLVGIVLVVVGLWGVHRVIRLHVHTHEHAHRSADGELHTHEHTHAHAKPLGRGREHTHDAQTPAHGHTHGLLGIGALHGLAGTAHLLGILPALAMPSRASAVAYVIAFGIGSIVGMGVFTSALGLFVRAANMASRVATKAVLALTSLASIAVGGYWLWNA